MIRQKDMLQTVRNPVMNDHSGGCSGYINHPTAQVGLVLENTKEHYDELQRFCKQEISSCYSIADLYNRVTVELRRHYGSFQDLKKLEAGVPLKSIALIDWFGISRNIAHDYFISHLENEDVSIYE